MENIHVFTEAQLHLHINILGLWSHCWVKKVLLCSFCPLIGPRQIKFGEVLPWSGSFLVLWGWSFCWGLDFFVLETMPRDWWFCPQVWWVGSGVIVTMTEWSRKTQKPVACHQLSFSHLSDYIKTRNWPLYAPSHPLSLLSSLSLLNTQG